MKEPWYFPNLRKRGVFVVFTEYIIPKTSREKTSNRWPEQEGDPCSSP
jgi:hypothetical protein